LAEVHPLGKSPVITDGPLTIAESGAIIEYLVDKYGPELKPSADDSAGRLQYTFWLHYAEGSLMPLLVMKHIFGNVVTRSPFFIRPIARGISNSVHEHYITPSLKKHFAFIEAHLAKNKYFTGDKFSAADIQMSFPISATARAGELVGPGPKTMEWIQGIKEMESYKKALEKGGNFI